MFFKKISHQLIKLHMMVMTIQKIKINKVVLIILLGFFLYFYSICTK